MMNLQQIVIPTDSFMPFISTLIQRGLIAALAYFGATGFLSNDDVSKIASGLMAFALMIYGAYRSYKSNQQKLVMEPFVRDSIATTSIKAKKVSK